MSSRMGSSVSYTGATQHVCSLTPVTHMLSDIKWTHLSLLVVVQYRAVQCEAATLTINCVDLLQIWTSVNGRLCSVEGGAMPHIARLWLSSIVSPLFNR